MLKAGRINVSMKICLYQPKKHPANILGIMLYHFVIYENTSLHPSIDFKGNIMYRLVRLNHNNPVELKAA